MHFINGIWEVEVPTLFQNLCLGGLEIDRYFAFVIECLNSHYSKLTHLKAFAVVT